MSERERLLAAYDEQLRTDAETPGAIAVTRHGPLRLCTFAVGRGFITYRDLGGADADGVRALVAAAVDHFTAAADVGSVEWKTRGHDHAPGLHDALVEHGFEPEDQESILIGEARLLAAEVPLPDGVTLRRITEEHDVRAMAAMQAEVFGDLDSDHAEGLLRRLARGDRFELWVAEARGQVVAGGRLEPVPGTEFAGLWGGATRHAWRGRGLYRALTAARARAALDLGFALVNSDSTEYSRPILERAGLLKVSTTTPYRWKK